MQPKQLTPDYWIDMGAMAIATLAGALLLSARDQWSLLRDLTPFLTGFALLSWTMATWWIPLLLILEVWRLARGRVLWGYSLDYWSFVFPLGMYSVATAMLINAIHVFFLNLIATLFACMAIVTWAVTFFGMIRNMVRRFGQALMLTFGKPGLK